MTFYYPAMLGLLLVLPLMVLLWWWRGMRTIPPALVLRLFAVTLVVVALARPTSGADLEHDGPLVVLVDQSDSLTAEGRVTLRQQAQALVEAAVATVDDTSAAGFRPTDIALLWFGAQAVAPGEWGAAQPVAELPDTLRNAVDPTASNLAEALRTARSLLAETATASAPGRVILLSDGLETSGDVLAETRLLAEAGVQVDVLPYAQRPRPELRIASVRAPDTLSAGAEYAVNISIVNDTAVGGAPAATEAVLRLWEGDDLLGEETVALEPGANAFTFRSRAGDPGVLRLRATLAGTPDTFAANNSAAATALVSPPPSVLLVEGSANQGLPLANALLNAGIESERIPAERLPTRLSDLARYDGMVLVDVSANNLTFDQMASVQEFVRSEGRGLVVTGGVNSYGLGGYEDTPLENVLPVTMESPPRPDRAEVALLLIIDRSASMDTALGVSKFDMAKEAAILSTETLQSEDTIGVLAFDTGQQWAVPLQVLGEGIGLKQIQDNIATLPTGGGTDIFSALARGLGELSRLPNEVRHVVLLTDGRSFNDDRGAYQQLAQAALAQNITISTIGIGFDADTELLDQLAQWGGGRYYFADAAEDIPRLTLQESEIARADPGIEGAFQAELVEPHPLLREFSPAGLPVLNGYVATTAREGGDLVLRSPDNDPILSAWQYGLGRAVAWTTSADDPWAGGWLSWSEYSRFWGQVVRYTLPTADSGPMQVRLMPQAGGARLVADVVRANGAPLDLAVAQATLTLPDGTEHIISLRQDAPGIYAQDLLLPLDGAYGIQVVLERDGQQYRTAAGYVQATPAEYLPPAPDTLHGAPLLAQVAAATGGTVLAPDTGLVANNAAPAAPDADPLRNLWVWLLLMALVAWVIEIAMRRGLFIRDR